MIGLYAAVFGADGTAFDERKYIALHALTGNVGTVSDLPRSDNFVNFVDKDYSVLLRFFDRFTNNLIHVDELVHFLLYDYAASILHAHFTEFFLLWKHIAQHFVKIKINANCKHSSVTGRHILIDADFYQSVLQPAVTEL